MLCNVFNGGGGGTPMISPRPDAGLVVAIIGSDGSGKSTLCRDLSAQLRSLGPVDDVYFGSGDGTSSWLRWPLVQARRLLPSPRATNAAPPRSRDVAEADTSRRPPLVAGARVVWALTLAWEKRAKLRAVNRARRRGRLVLCDRFPQAQVGGLMDGPLLHAWTLRRSGMRRAIAGWEARAYHLAERQPPDLVLRLVVDQLHAERRRPEHDPLDLRRRREIIAALRFDGARFGVVDLDATMPVEDVRRAALRAIDECRDGAPSS
ncbi:MAG: hypothetical protein AB7Q42_24860 [Acidimicrobiia bacterium]